MPTMTDVAKRAGVAVSTVSYALNGTRPISEETRQRIFAAIDELGYKPHALARGLASKRSRIIALLFPNSERGLGFTEFEFVTSAANAAKENQYSLVLWAYDMHDLPELTQLTQQGLVDGVVLMEVHRHDKRVAMLREVGFPFSMIGRCDDVDGMGYVDIDFHQTMQDAIDHLAGLGHHAIAFVNQSESAFSAGYGPVVRTQAAFEQITQERELNGVSQLCRTSLNAGYDAFNALIEAHPDLTAIISMNERAVPGILQAIAERGWSVPDDFSLVVVVSAAGMAEMIIPPLTALEPMTTDMGRRGVELLIHQLEGRTEADPQALIPCRLVVRSSTGPSPTIPARQRTNSSRERTPRIR
ncbi:MAG TPA: LacI family DNA-binding transcriptional regulator [Aggregatilinea sp.]|jgi:DNA-binding LacI/PurR family transcriptional regulator|nr:LacI family DNA-binding transcriptional regulator [Aggregatilinea sp.]